MRGDLKNGVHRRDRRHWRDRRDRERYARGDYRAGTETGVGPLERRGAKADLDDFLYHRVSQTHASDHIAYLDVCGGVWNMWSEVSTTKWTQGRIELTKAPKTKSVTTRSQCLYGARQTSKTYGAFVI